MVYWSVYWIRGNSDLFTPIRVKIFLRTYNKGSKKVPDVIP